MRRTLKSRFLLSTMIGGLVATSGAAFAQDADFDDELLNDDEVIVTGSRIQNVNVITSSPVVTIDSELFDVRGTTDTVDLINTLPSVTPAQTTAFANGATGTSTINLRGLGSQRTLVLVDGKRLPPGGPLGGFAADLNLIAPQLVERVEVVTGGASAVYGSDAIAGVANFITRKDFEGVELDLQYGQNQSNNGSDFFQERLTDAGIDPVSGSVWDNETFQANLLLGAGLGDGRGNVTAYFNYAQNDGIQQGDRDFSQCATLPVGDDDLRCLGSNQGPFPTTFVVSAARAVDADGENLDPLDLFDADGAPLLDAMGTQRTFIRNVPIVGAFQTAADRQLGFDADGDVIQDFDGVTDAVLAFDADGNPVLNPLVSLNASLGLDDNLSEGFNNAFNFNPFNPIRRETERFNAGFNGYYDVADNVTAYLDFGFTSSSSPQIIAPSAAFGATINRVNCDNPLLTDETREAICGDADIDGDFVRDTDGDGFAQAQIRRRFVEGGPRTDDRRRTNFRVVSGLRGNVLDQFDWDVFGQYSETTLSRVQFNQVTLDNLTDSLDIVTDPVTGNPVCRSTLGANPSNPSCVPFTSAFQNGVPSSAELASFVDTPTLTTGTSSQTVFGGTIGGELDEQGIKSPYAEESVSLLLGFEYRRDELFTQADGIAAAGNLVGAGGATVPTNGSTSLYEVFAEAQLPLISGVTGIEQFNLTGALRWSDYSSSNNLTGGTGGIFDATTYALGASWVPVDDLRIRGQYQRAIRAPNVNELFLPQNTGLQSLSDPCSGTSPTATAAACANTGLPGALFGQVPADSGQLNTLTGGNPNLIPETSDTFTLGVVYQPSRVEGLTVSLDYFDITVEDAIGSIPASTSLQQCLDTGDAQFCDLIQRGPDGSLTFFPRELSFISAASQNIAEFKTTGIDGQVAYGFDIGNFGDVSLNYNATYLLSFDQTLLPGAGTFDCVGFYAQACGSPNFEYRHNMQATYQTPGDVRFSGVWRYSSGVDLAGTINSGLGQDGAITSAVEDGSRSIDESIDATGYIDLAAFWDATDNLTLRVGANNVLDNDPPIVTTFGDASQVTVEANTIAGVYDAGGRFLFVGANLKF